MLLKVLADLLQNYYPERLGRLYIINAPIFFNAAWAIIKVWLDKRIIDKVNVLGSDYAQVLNDHIDHHQHPSFLGGSCTCSHMDGGCVPPTRGEKTPANPDGYRFTKALKKSSNSHSHDVHVAEHGSTLTFQYTSSTALTLEIHETDSKTRIHQAIDQTSGQGTVAVEHGKKYSVSWKSDQISSYSSAKLDYSLDVLKPNNGGGKTAKTTDVKAKKETGSPVSPDVDEFHDAEE
jgi:hypothetical protein